MEGVNVWLHQVNVRIRLHIRRFVRAVVRIVSSLARGRAGVFRVCVGSILDSWLD